MDPNEIEFTFTAKQIQSIVNAFTDQIIPIECINEEIEILLSIIESNK